VNALPPLNIYRVGPFGPKSGTFSIWNQRIRTTDPLPAQVASIDKDGVLRILRVLMGGKFLRRGYALSERTSRWIWALLARLPDRGELNHAEISWIRDLGRRAVLMVSSLADMAALREEVESGRMDLGVHDDVDDSEEDEENLQEMIVEEEDGDGLIADTNSPNLVTKNADHGGKHIAESEQLNDSLQDSNGDDMEEGEVDELEADIAETSENLEDARARVLAQLEDIESVDSEPNHSEDENSDQTRARLNMRATLNMILTVAGEFYGQRDLLEFRDPFTGL
jgi:hypothetical protein